MLKEHKVAIALLVCYVLFLVGTGLVLSARSKYSATRKCAILKHKGRAV